MGIKLRQLLFLLCFFAALSAKAQTHHYSYYGKDFYEAWQNHKSEETLKQLLHNVLQNWHLPSNSGFDSILENCSQPECYHHTWQSYADARKTLFGEIHLVQSKSDGYGVQDVYCNRVRFESEFKTNPPRPGKIPNPQVVNAEHTWPQSKFSSKYSKDLQKSDLHSLYSVYSRANSSRSNDPFGEVATITSQVCPESKKGLSPNGSVVFEPPNNHKGNVARALFYFSIRYEISIDENQEHFLRSWHQLDPVDTEEIQRNETVFLEQKNRNPFIDHPELVDSIQDF
ncbi:MAG: endonuclease [Bdellovibrionales bacterium]|nr:endonuclease [Bdellovibrionales bacterium]